LPDPAGPFGEALAELADVPLGIVGDRVLGLDCFPSPGHANHHVCYLAADGTLYAGDTAGVRIQPAAYVMPPTPPPEVDLEAWSATVDEIERRGPERLALRYTGRPFRTRDKPRVSAWLEPERWHGWS